MDVDPDAYLRFRPPGRPDTPVRRLVRVAGKRNTQGKAGTARAPSGTPRESWPTPARSDSSTPPAFDTQPGACHCAREQRVGATPVAPVEGCWRTRESPPVSFATQSPGDRAPGHDRARLRVPSEALKELPSVRAVNAMRPRHPGVQHTGRRSIGELAWAVRPSERSVLGPGSRECRT